MILHKYRCPKAEAETLCVINGYSFEYLDGYIYYLEKTGNLCRINPKNPGKRQSLISDIEYYAIENDCLYAWSMPRNGQKIFCSKNLTTGEEEQFSFPYDPRKNTDAAEENKPEENNDWQTPYDPTQILADCKAFLQSRHLSWADNAQPESVKSSKQFRTNSKDANKTLKEQVWDYILSYAISGNNRTFHVSVEPIPDSSGEYQITVFVL